MSEPTASSELVAEDRLRALAERHGQAHVFRFWDQLDEPQRQSLLRQIAGIDFELVNRLRQTLTRVDDASVGGDLEPTPIVRLPTSRAEESERSEARIRGEELLRQGMAAAFVVAGGQGSRLGLEGPKGAFEVGPVTHRSLFQVHAEKILALSRRYRSTVPFLVMTSETNHDATVDFFRDHRFFGLDPEAVLFFQQATLPAVDRDGRFVLERKDRIFTSPNGHGGSLKALWDSGAIGWLDERGVETIFYFQVDNPLVSICDPVFLGHHVGGSAEMSSKIVRKRDWQEKVGVIGRRGGRTTVIEYSDLSEHDARATLEDGSLKYWAGSIAIHVLQVDFVRRLNEGGFQLPYHRACKKIRHVDETGNPVDPEAPNGYKFETFVFDALTAADTTITVETSREDEFSPVKNATGEDSPETSRCALTALYLRWLESCGAVASRAPDGLFPGHVEISPLTALGPEDLPQRVRPGEIIQPGLVL